MDHQQNNEKICFTLDSILPNSSTVTLAAACVCFITTFCATLLAAAMIYFGLKRYQNELRFGVIVSLTLANIVSGILYLDKHISVKRKSRQQQQPQNGGGGNSEGAVFDLFLTTIPSPEQMIFISPGLCETLQFLYEFSFSSLIVWLAAECVHLIIIASTKPTTIHIQRRQWFKLGVYLVPGILYPFTFVGLWLTFKLIHRQHWLGCFERNDYDLTTSVPNAVISSLTSLFAFCLVIVFCLPKYMRSGRGRFLPCLVNWLSTQPLQALALLQSMNYASRKFVLYYGEAHDMAFQVLHIVFGPWIVALFTILLVCQIREARQESRSLMHLIM